MKAILLMLLSLSCTAQAGEQQGSTDLSNASQLATQGSATVVYGSLAAVAASGTVLVESVQVAGEASMIVLAGASGAARATIRLSGQAAREAALVAGAAVNVVAASTGTMLVAGGKVLAFIPNQIGRSLIHHSRASERG